MANAITLAKAYLPLLDEVYKMASKTSILDAPAEWVRGTANANEVLIPKIVLDGLGTYNRNTGFTAGDATLTWETHTFAYDRGRTFSIDDMDDDETLNVAFSAVTSQFIRTKVVPEVDAVRFDKMAGLASAGTSAVLTKSTVLTAIDVGREAMAEAEVEATDTVLFVSPKVYTFLKNADTITRSIDPQNANRQMETLDEIEIIQVPQSRFYKGITLYDGTTAGQEAGGYIKTAVTGRDLNFLLVDKKAVLGITKTALPRIFDPMTNQTANAWKFDYRLYHDLFVPNNKVDGIYYHTSTS